MMLLKEVLKAFAKIGEVGQDVSLLVLFVAYLVAMANTDLTSFLTRELRMDLLLIALFFWFTWIIHSVLYVDFKRALKKYHGTKYQVDVIK